MNAWPQQIDVDVFKRGFGGPLFLFQLDKIDESLLNAHATTGKTNMDFIKMVE